MNGRGAHPLNAWLPAALRCSLADFVGQQTHSPQNNSHSRLLPLEVKPKSRDHVPDGMHLRDALTSQEYKETAVRPAAQLLGQMVASSLYTMCNYAEVKMEAFTT